MSGCRGNQIFVVVVAFVAAAIVAVAASMVVVAIAVVVLLLLSLVLPSPPPSLPAWWLRGQIVELYHECSIVLASCSASCCSDDGRLPLCLLLRLHIMITRIITCSISVIDIVMRSLIACNLLEAQMGKT